MDKGLWLMMAVAVVFAAATTRAEDAAGDGGLDVGGGLKVGFNVATLGGDDADWNEDAFWSETGARFGASLGGFVTVGLHEWFAIQPEVYLFSMKGAAVKTVDKEYRRAGFGDEAVYHETIKTVYLEFPLLAKLRIPLDGPVQPWVATGPALSVKAAAEVVDEDGNVVNMDDAVRTFDAGWVASAGVDVPVGRGAIVLDLRYNLGLMSIDVDAGADLRNRVFSVLTGYAF